MFYLNMDYVEHAKSSIASHHCKSIFCRHTCVFDLMERVEEDV